MRDARSWPVVLAVVLVVMGGLAPFVVVGVGTATAQQATEETHELRIEFISQTKSDPSEYSLSVSGQIKSMESERGDLITSPGAAVGEVGPADEDDVIIYTGKLLDLGIQGGKDTIKLYINGTEVNEKDYQYTNTPSSESPTTTTTSDKSHTLVIKPKGNTTGQYSGSFSSTPTLKNSEQADSITGTSVNGNVGGLPWKPKQTDTKDVIEFRGEIQDFEASNVTVKLDGKQVAPGSLSQTPGSDTPTSSPTATQGTGTAASPTATDGSPSTSTQSLPTPPTVSDQDGGGSSFGDILLGLVIGIVVVLIGGLVLQRW